jgi:hypothetical protein
MSEKKRGQSAIEFVILIGIALFFFVGFLIAIQGNIATRVTGDRDIIVQEIAAQVQDEITLAASSTDGYYREFNIPEKVVNIDYDITVDEGVVYVRTENGKHAIALPAERVVGNIVIGENFISRKDGVIYLNAQLSPEVTCGDGILDAGEQCDDPDFAGETCVTQGFDTGELTCTPSCTFDTSACTTFSCGDGVQEGIEECDGTDLDGEGCISQGFTAGFLGCSGTCIFDTTGCTSPNPCVFSDAFWSVVTATEGDTVGLFVDGTVGCDGLAVDFEIWEDDITGDDAVTIDPANANFIGSTVSSSWIAEYQVDASGNPEYYFIGTLVSDPGVTFQTPILLDVSELPPPVVCGNGVQEGIEECDLTDLNSQTCLTQGFDSGSLSCTGSCTFDTSSCTTVTPCTFSTAVWDVTTATEGDTVGITVTGIGDCNAEAVSYVVWEDDVTGDDPVITEPINSVFFGTTTTGSWTAEYQVDASGNPEYYFVATMMTNPGETIQSTNQLDVSELPPPIVCGDGVAEGTEECDLTDFAGETCVTQGFDSGSLSCTGSCTIDTGACSNIVPCTFSTGSWDATTATEGDVVGLTLTGTGDCDGLETNYVVWENDVTGDDPVITEPVNTNFVGGTVITSWVSEFQNDGVGDPEYYFIANLVTNPGETFTSTNELSVAEAPTPVVCGDGLREAPEQCDLTDLNGQTCMSLGFVGGSLSCDGSCNFDTTSCLTEICGNGIQEGSEGCDGSDLAGQTCMTLGYPGGTLACSESCTFDESGCLTQVCGNANQEGTEDCDGADLAGQTCISLGFDSGVLSCDGICGFDTNSCVTYVCGNGIVEGTEQCDLADLNGQNCISRGYDAGTLACSGACLYDESGCTTITPCTFSTAVWDVTTATEGDAVGISITGAGDCGGETVSYVVWEDDVVGDDSVITEPVNTVFSGTSNSGTWIAEYQVDASGNPEYYFIATLVSNPGETITSTNQLDVSEAPSVPVCGDGLREAPEQCDLTDLNSQTCITLGYAGGTLSCDGLCVFDTTSCLTQVCGNAIQEGTEDCDGADLNGGTCQSEGFDSGTLGCDGSCNYETSSCQLCGNGNQEGTEACDGSDLNGETCISQGYQSGTLACTAGCAFDVSSCSNAVCGNGIQETGEQCDGSDLGGSTCLSLSFEIDGTLSCGYDTTDCEPTSPQPCPAGNGNCVPGEDPTITVTWAGATHYVFVDFESTLQGWYLFNNNIDVSGKGNHGSFFAGASAGVPGGKFGMTSNYVGGSSGFNIGNKFAYPEGSVSFWVRLQSTISPGWGGNWKAFGKDSTYEGGWYTTDGKFSVNLGGFKTMQSTKTVWNAGQWYLITITWDTSEQNLYVDGFLQNTGPAVSMPQSSNQFFFGRSGSESGSSMIGSIDEALVFSRKLAAGEIPSLFNGDQYPYSSTFTGLDPGPYSYYGWVGTDVGTDSTVLMSFLVS